MLSSLRSRLIASYMVVVLVCLLIIGLSLLVIVVRSSGVADRVESLRLVEAARAALRNTPPPAAATPEELNQYARQAAAAHDVRVLIVDEAGRVAADSAVLAGTARPGDIPTIDSFQAELTGTLKRGAVRDAGGRIWLFVSRSVGRTGWQVVFASPRPGLRELLREDLLAPIAQAAAVGLALSVLMAWLIAEWVARPLQKAAAAASAMARGKFDQTVPVSGPSEVQSLARSFNDMSARVRAAQQTQRDFVANVSHELKTPLTSIQGFSQAILDGAAADPGAVRRAAHIISDEAERMRRLVEGLLDLARLDAGQATVHRAPTDLAALLQSVAEKLSLRAAEKQIVLRAEIEPLPAMVADADRLAQVFTNLLDNALQHTPAGAAVSFKARAAAGEVTVTVTDSGSGIPPEDLPRIFERFYRVDKARAAGKGYGLGLAISKEIIQAHGGTIGAESVVGLGTRFTVKLPVARGDDTTVVKRRPPVK